MDLKILHLARAEAAVTESEDAAEQARDAKVLMAAEASAKTDPRTLNLSFMQLSRLPAVQGIFSRRLQYLYLNGNRLSALPDAVCNLTSLWQLLCFDNRLVELPATVGRLINLHELDVHGNLLTTLPPSVAKLKALVRLDVSYNRLSRTPELDWLDALRQLPLLRRTPDNMPPRSTLRLGLPAVRRYFEDLESRPPPPFSPPRERPRRARWHSAEKDGSLSLSNSLSGSLRPRSVAFDAAAATARADVASAASTCCNSSSSASYGGKGGAAVASSSSSAAAATTTTAAPAQPRTGDQHPARRAADAAGGALEVRPSDIKLGRLIGEGAFAEVHRGLLWGQRVAVKRLMVDREGADKETLERELLHETRLLAQISHPCVTQLIGFTPAPLHYVVLEVLDGTIYDLALSFYNEGQGGSALLIPLLDLLSACAYLHARSPPLLHRDLKPPNILHDANGRCKLCDFGTCLELHRGAPPPTEWVGSQLYIAPEVDRQDPYGLPADVFSFGVLAYELYHMVGTGINFYGEGDMFEGGGLVDGLETLRAPLLLTPQEWPPRPDASGHSESVWSLLCAAMRADAAARPSFAELADGFSDVRHAEGGKQSEWL